MWAKYNEIINLRVVFRGKTLDEPITDIKKNLYFAGDEEESGAAA
jgi:hypothetical protein